jgi:predicted protein tyrosine phosphatase
MVGMKDMATFCYPEGRMLTFKKVIVIDRAQAEAIKPASLLWAIISIRGTDDLPVEFGEHGPAVQVLHLLFDDIEKVTEGLTAFSVKTAHRVWDFVEKVWSDADKIVVHCQLGACRSPGIAAAICKVKYGDDSIWFQRKTPNRRVFRAMLVAAQERGLL